MIAEPIVDETSIRGFFGEYRFLSNYHKCPITFEGLTYGSTEAAYQAAKTVFPGMREAFTTMEPNQSKKEGQNLPLRADWEEHKDNIMYTLNFIKFQDPELRAQLMATGKKYLEETNWWNDKYWGVCDGVGKNKLGITLMKVRAAILEIEQSK